jgi:di/tricarboxylate transporter
MIEEILLFGEYSELVLVLGLLAAAIVMFVKNKPRMDAVAIIMIAALPFSGIISIEETLMGFSDPNIILIAVLFVLGEGMVRTGVARNIGDWINQKANNSETKLMVLLMVAVAGLGSVMSSTAIVAIFIPVVFRICSNTGISPSHLMMPLSFAALISGMMTLISTAPNLVVNSELMRQGEAGFDFFTITPFGLAILGLGLIYMLIAKKWLPNNASQSTKKRKRPTFKVLVDKYNLHDKEHRVAIQEGSPLLDMQINELDFGKFSVNLLAVERKEGTKTVFNRPTKQMNFMEGDVLLLDAGTNEENLSTLFEKYNLDPQKLSGGRGYLSSTQQEMGMTEAILPAESNWVGKSIKDARIRSETGLTVVAVMRGSQIITQDLLDLELNIGDTLLLAGFWDDIKRVIQESDNVVLLYLPPEIEEVLPAADKAPHASGHFGFGGTPYGDRNPSQRARSDPGLFVDGLVPNRGHEQCLSVHFMEEFDFNCRHDALFPGTTAHGWCGIGVGNLTGIGGR